MDDLNGLEWTTTSNFQKPNASTYPSLRPSPAPSSGRSTPGALSLPIAPVPKLPIKIGSKPATPANDSFASLLSSGQTKPSNKVSLQERQQQLQEEQAKQSRHFDTHFGSRISLPLQLGGLQATSSNGAGKSSLRSISPNSTLLRTQTSNTSQDGEDDVLAAFDSSVTVDSSSYYPPQRIDDSARSSIPDGAPTGSTKVVEEYPEDDPFGLDQFAARYHARSVPATTSDDNDILGMLGRPVHEFPAINKSEPVNPTRQEKTTLQDDFMTNISDKSVAELVDMGFAPDKAVIALAQTDSGYDVRAAVGILLNQAHEDSKKTNRTSRVDKTHSKPLDTLQERQARNRDNTSPSWTSTQDNTSRGNSHGRESARGQEKDVAKLASDIGSNLFKSANTLWKTSQKKVQKAMADMQVESNDSGQPKWMRDAHAAEGTRRTAKTKESSRREAEITDEAAMLDHDNSRLNHSQLSSSSLQSKRPESLETPIEQRNMSSSRMSSRSAEPEFTNNTRLMTDHRSASRVTREDLEKDAPAAYISPARRKKASPTGLISLETSVQQGSPLSLPPIQSNNPFIKATQKTVKSPALHVPLRPKAPIRQIPSVSSLAITASSSHRQKGTEASKRGDFSSAHVAYSNALEPLPRSHPLTIIIFCNRALTNLKNGEPKAAIADAECALTLIGVSKGEGEKIDLGASEGEKDMKEFYSKALMRKAEALENMEKWSEAGQVWREAVEAGVGGSLSIQGRTRCEKSAGRDKQMSGSMGIGTNGSKASRSVQTRRAPLRRPVANAAASQEAVRKLRKANEAAERADDEKFALIDQVDAKLQAWKGSKADNLRALLGSLDNVLWPEAGWTKVGMADLIMVNRVKIVYMKAIAKVHPDKISQSATTEQRMLSGAIFSTLNAAWDKFKQENNL